MLRKKKKEVMEVKGERRTYKIFTEESRMVNYLGNYSRVAWQDKGPLEV